MSARPAGSFATLLMSGPLVAIPLMAIFGVPEFTSVSEFIDRDPQSERFEPSQEIGSDGITAESVNIVTEVAPLERSDRSPREEVPQPQRWTPQPSPMAGESRELGAEASSHLPAVPLPEEFLSDVSVTIRDSQGIAELSEFEPVDGRAIPIGANPDAAVVVAEETLWESAAERLRELGIDDYRLEQGQRPGSSLFICQFVPGADARIVRRFEAEGETPIDAVQNVLEQIDHWKRHTDSSLVNAR